MSDSEPWLDNKDWRDNLISSGAKYAHWVLAGFALVWNAISSTIFFQFDQVWRKIQEEPVVAFVFLFPLIGLVLIAMTVRAFQAWRRFGPTPLVLDPFPGSVGGQVGGWVDTRIAYKAGQRYHVSLSCLKSSVSGSGKNRKRSESVKWQTDGVCHTERSGLGTQLRFRFDLPANLPTTDIKQSGTYHLWRVNVSAELDGPDFERRFEIPVFPTATQSTIEDGTEDHAGTVDLATEGVESIADIRPVPGGIEAYFPALQRPGQGIFSLLFGLFFSGVGIGVGYSKDGGVVIPVVFTLVGLAILFYGIFYLGKSLLVGVTGEGVRCRRFLLGYPLKKQQYLKQDFRGFEIDEGATMTSGNKTTVYYRVYARGNDGNRFPVAERLSSRAEAELLKETYEAYCGSRLN